MTVRRKNAGRLGGFGAGGLSGASVFSVLRMAMEE